MSESPRTIDAPQAIGASEAFLAVQERISRAAGTDRPVILIGERGTGKELAALRLHMLSPRWNEPYLTLNCAALPENLIESELFGHEAGAFTGATRQRVGRFEAAHEGSLFLDEIANTPMTVQEKILRVVEYGQMERVGGSTSLRLDVRLIAATNVDLRREAEAGRFRSDLLDRLAFEVIVLPPLRKRAEDIDLLADHFIRRMAVELGRTPPELSPAAREALRRYPWPGNVRELKNVVERMTYQCREDRIETVNFDPFDHPHMPAPPPQPASRHEPPAPPPSPAADSGLDRLPLPEAVRVYEVRRIRAALKAHQHHQGRAAEALGLSYHQLRNLLRKYRDEIG